METIDIIAMATYVIMGICFVALVVVGFVLLKQSYTKASKKKKQQVETGNDKKKKSYDGVERGVVQDFMEFDKIQDDMIIKKDGTEFCMVIECKGINYDLMSQNERISVEDGFVQTLNILRYPIQLYIQTRAADYNSNLKDYEDRLAVVKGELDKLRVQYEHAYEDSNVSEDKLQMLKFELRKKENQYSYGLDVIEYIKKMNLNKSILQKKFYVIATYYSTELGITTKLGKDEIMDYAYQELYNRCQSITNALGGCQVVSKVLDSVDLAELLYVAYNRDDAEVLNLRNMLKSGYYSLYTTSEDVLNKKKKYIKNKIEEEALQKAQDAMDEAQNILQISKNDEDFRKTYKKAIEDGAIDVLLNSRGKYPDGLIKLAIDQVNEAILAKQKKRAEKGNEAKEEVPTVRRGRKRKTA